MIGAEQCSGSGQGIASTASSQQGAQSRDWDLDSGISGDINDLHGCHGIDEGMLPHIDLQVEGIKEISTKDGWDTSAIMTTQVKV